MVHSHFSPSPRVLTVPQVVTRLLSSPPIRPLYAAIVPAYWQPRRYSAPPRAVPPKELHQEKTESRLGISRTSLGGRRSILAEPAPRKACGLFHLRSPYTSESLL